MTDSSGFLEPRVLARVFPAHDHVEETVRFYQHMTGAAVDMDLDVPEAGFRIVAVGSFLILDLDPTVLERAEVARATAVTMIFADLDAAVRLSLAAGSVLVGEQFAAPTGRGARLRHPDGLLVEYLEHRPSPDDVEPPGSDAPNADDAGGADSADDADEPAGDRMGVLSFGYDGDGGLGDRLVAAVVRGDKTATSSLAVEYLSGEPLPKVGERVVVVDHAGRRHGVVETTKVAIIPLHLVGDDVAHAEGEGFADAAAWREDHRRFWAEVAHLVQEESGDPDWQLRDAEPVVVHWFRFLRP